MSFNEIDFELINSLETLTSKLKTRLEKQDIKLKKAQRKNEKINGDQEADMIMEMLRAYFERYSYLNIEAEISIQGIKTWDDFINKLDNHIRY